MSARLVGALSASLMLAMPRAGGVWHEPASFERLRALPDVERDFICHAIIRLVGNFYGAETASWAFQLIPWSYCLDHVPAHWHRPAMPAETRNALLPAIRKIVASGEFAGAAMMYECREANDVLDVPASDGDLKSLIIYALQNQPAASTSMPSPSAIANQNAPTFRQDMRIS